jgi:nitrogen fixation protein FixH
MKGEFTGRRMAGILIAFFGVVIAVNLAMARLAGSTFAGVVVENSYVASQHFNRWLDAAAQEKALGWQAQASRDGANRIVVVLTGTGAEAAQVSAVARHPLGRLADRPLAFAAIARGRFVSAQALPAGRWRLRLEVTSAGQNWRTEQDLF